MAKNWAIVVGINQYRFLQPLRYAKRDAETMQAFLSQTAGFDQIFLFTDDSPELSGKTTEPFRNNLLRVLRQIFEKPFMADGDNFWFFFSGHGMRYREQDYLMPLDGDPEDVEHTGISTHLIANYLRSCGADNAVMILDACRSEGKKSGEGIGRQTEAEARQTGVISIFSCSPEQYSYEIEAIGQGAFTCALLEGLGIRGRCATVERLNQYLANRVPELVQQHLGRARQIPYTIAEPIDRSHLILMPQHASLSDIATLKNDAYRAQMEQDWERAERLWIRVLAVASGQDTDAIKALQMIAIKRNAGTIPEPSQPPKPPEAPLPELKKDSEKVVTPSVISPQPAQPSPAPSPLPTSTQKLAQQYSNRSRVARSAREIPLIDQPTPQQWTRQRFLKLAGFGSAGLLTAVVGREVFKSGSLSEPQLPISKPQPPSEPAPPISKSQPPLEPSPVSVAEPKYTQLTEEVAEGLPLWRIDFETVEVNERGQVVDRVAKQANFFKENLGNGVILEMVKIPTGSFSMGSPNIEKDRNSSESPQHTVKVPSFFMGKFAVTQAQYQQLMGNNPARFKGENRPVEQVSWNDAVELCAKLSKQTGRTYRLPSEAEWEYACRAGTTTPFYFGKTITSALANCRASTVYRSEPKGEYRQQTTEVGTFSPNAFGLYDMHGNVWEWCQDHWHDNYQGAPNDGSAWLSEDEELSRLMRGGSWGDFPRDCRSATRDYNVVGVRNDIGFRVVCVVS
jgi:formylglycine-generating enzyme required for sulfatase activity/uncharacterized caspase-like protein